MFAEKKLSKNEILRLAIKYIQLLTNVLDWQKQQDNLHETSLLTRNSYTNIDMQTGQDNHRSNYDLSSLMDRHNPSQMM